MTPGNSSPGNTIAAHADDDPRRLIDAHLDGSLSDKESQTLARWLGADPANIELLLDRAALHLSLRKSLTRNATTPAAKPPARAASAGRPHRFEIPTPGNTYVYATAALVAIATIIVALYLLPLNPEPSPPDSPEPSTAPLANLIENASGGTLTTPGGFISEGRDYPRGEYTLDKGTAEFMLTNAVNVKLRGETRMVMRNDMNVALTRGSANFVVPNDATGFTVHLPDGSRVVDLGTAFRVTVEDDGTAFVVVTRGLVKLISAGEQPVERELAAGWSAVRTGNTWEASESIAGQLDDDPALVARYTFDDHLDDATQFANHAAFHGGSATFTEGTLGSALQFDGVDDIVMLPRSEQTGFGRDSHTIAMWVRRDRSGRYEGLIENSQVTAGSHAIVLGPKVVSPKNDRIRVALWENGGARELYLDSSADSTITPDHGWRHMAVVVDRESPATVRLYLDGELTDTADLEPLRDADLTGTLDWTLGVYNNAAHFKGHLDDLRMYRRALTEDEINELAARP